MPIPRLMPILRPMPILRLVAALAVAATLSALPVQAATAQVAPGAGDPPYEEDLTRLSEILGALHYLRGLCGADEGQLWRTKMAELLEAEAPSEVRRARLVDSFNRGFRGFRNTYSSCTESAAFIIDRYLTEGSEISARIATRYGN